jgi:RNA polymerase sigma-70 factor (sigma-E family)
MAVLDGPDAPDAGDGHAARVTPGPPGRAGPHRPPDGHEVSVAPGAGGLSGAHHPPGLQQDVAGLFRDRHAELVRLAALVVGDRATAEDVVQDVFARLCAKDLLPDTNPLAYVRAAVLNGCRSVLRRRVLVLRHGGGHEPGLADLAQESAEDEAILAENRREVLAALAALPVRRREVLVLRYWLGLSEAEIASVMAISPGTVKSNAARGLAALARKLGEES